MMNLSVVIPASKDFRLLKCINSVDVDAEIVIVFNNNPSQRLIRESCGDIRVKPVMISTPGCNLAHVFNMGIQNSSHDYILIMNSDCVFCPGKVELCYSALQTASVVKGRILFESNSFTTNLVAQLRFLFHEIFGEKKALFGPGLAFNRDIVNQIGGYYFDEEMEWGEDGELSQRIYNSGLKVYHLEQVIMSHPPESIFHDLRVAYRIGYGEWIQHAKSGMTLPKAVLTDLLNLFFDRKRRFRTALVHGGFSLASYLLLWKMVSHSGYYFRAIRKKGERHVCKD